MKRPRSHRWFEPRLPDGEARLRSRPENRRARSCRSVSEPGPAGERGSRRSEGYFSTHLVHVDASHKPEKVCKILLDAVLSAEGVLQEPPPVVRYKGITNSSAEYSVTFGSREWVRSFGDSDVVWRRIWTHLQWASMWGGDGEQGEAGVASMAALRDLEIFAAFSDEDSRVLSEHMRRRDYRAGEMILRQNDRGDSMFVIAEGVVEVSVELEDGTRVNLKDIGAGAFFGEMALVTGEPRYAWVVAKTDTCVYEIGRQQVVPLLEKYPDFRRPLSEILAARSVDSGRQIQQHREAFQVEEQPSIADQIFENISRFFES